MRQWPKRADAPQRRHPSQACIPGAALLDLLLLLTPAAPPLETAQQTDRP